MMKFVVVLNLTTSQACKVLPIDYSYLLLYKCPYQPDPLDFTILF